MKKYKSNNKYLQCPEPPSCCESGQYALDECGCCMKCAKVTILAVRVIVRLLVRLKVHKANFKYERYLKLASQVDDLM